MGKNNNHFFFYLCTLLFCLLAFSAAIKNFRVLSATAPVTKSRVIFAETIKDIQEKNLKNSTAQQTIEKITLENLNKSNWYNKDGLKMQIYFADVNPLVGEELIVTVSYGKDYGAVVIYGNKQGNYVMLDSLKSFAPIEEINFLQLPGLKQKALAIYDKLDEMIGAFYNVNTCKIFIYKGNKLSKIWERDTYREEYFPEDYKIKGNQTQWLMKRETAKIYLLKNGDLEVKSKLEHGASKSIGELHSQYEITSSEKITELYEWDSKNLQYQKK